jgi:conjugal transfer pilus assembly protein TraE
MKIRLLIGRLDSLTHQRQALLTLVAFLLAIALTQALVLLLRGERVVVVPPEVTRRFWVSNTRVSAAYLEEMALFFGSLFLDVTPSSAAYKRDLILRHVVPESYGALKTKLLEDERRLKKDHVITSFQAVVLKVDASKGTVELTGDLLRFVGEKRISQSRDTYRLQLVYNVPHLLIQSFQLIRSDKNA